MSTIILIAYTIIKKPIQFKESVQLFKKHPMTMVFTSLNVLSTVCNFSNEGIGAYTASKASFDALVKVFRKEVRLKNIKVCSIYPGGTNTAFRNTNKPEYLEVESVVEAIFTMILVDLNASIDELTIRPMVEKNYN